MPWLQLVLFPKPWQTAFGSSPQNCSGQWSLIWNGVWALLQKGSERLALGLTNAADWNRRAPRHLQRTALSAPKNVAPGGSLCLKHNVSRSAQPVARARRCARPQLGTQADRARCFSTVLTPRNLTEPVAKLYQRIRREARIVEVNKEVLPIRRCTEYLCKLWHMV